MKNLYHLSSRLLKMAEKRNVNIDALRTLMMLLIVSLHMSSVVYDIHALRLQQGCVSSSILVGLRSIMFMGVSCFAFISGYFGVKFDLSKLLKYEVMAISMGLVNLMVFIFIAGSITLRQTVSFLMPFSSQTCWYLNAYFLLLLVAPFVNEGVKKIEKNKFLILIGLLTVSCYGIDFLYRRDGTNFFIIFIIYLIGRYVRMNIPKFFFEKAKYFFAVALLSQFTLVFLCNYLGWTRVEEMLENNHNPLLIIASIGLFLWLLKHEKQNIFFVQLSKIAPYMFAVYVFHVELLSFFPREHFVFFESSMVNFFGGILFIFILSVLVAFLQNLFFEMVKRRLVK